MVVVAAGEVNHGKSGSTVLSSLLGAEHLKDKMQHNDMYVPARSQLLSLMNGTPQKLGLAHVTFALASFALTPPAEIIFIQCFNL